MKSEFDTICIASGASLTAEDVDYCKGKAKIYAVNNVYQICPFADIFYACDLPWWDFHYNKVMSLKGEKWTIDFEASRKYNLNQVGYDKSLDWSETPNLIASGHNSGFQALNLAAIQGAKGVILLGYDMQNKGKSHFHGDHEGAMNKSPNFNKWIDHFRNAAKKIKIPVVNCTRDTALDAFPICDLKDVL